MKNWKRIGKTIIVVNGSTIRIDKPINTNTWLFAWKDYYYSLNAILKFKKIRTTKDVRNFMIEARNNLQVYKGKPKFYPRK